MDSIFEKVGKNPLFQGIDAAEFSAMLGCVQGQLRYYAKGGVIQLSGEPIATVGLVTKGLVQVLREDEGGRQNLMAELGEGELFGEVFACADIHLSPVTVLAVQDSEVLHLNYRRVITTCSSSCAFHQQLIENMLAVVARKTLALNQKIEIISKRTTRERLLCYFDFYRQGARKFELPYRREELAAYLCVERSAMSAELSRMQQDGLIRYKKNAFELL